MYAYSHKKLPVLVATYGTRASCVLLMLCMKIYVSCQVPFDRSGIIVIFGEWHILKYWYGTLVMHIQYQYVIVPFILK
jgi:hypothetical protein